MNWTHEFEALQRQRDAAGDRAQRAKELLLSKLVEVVDGDTEEVAWWITPLDADSTQAVEDLAAGAALRPIEANFAGQMDQLRQDLPDFSKQASRLVGGRRFITNGKRRQEARAAAEYILETRDWGAAVDIANRLSILATPLDLEFDISREIDRLADPRLGYVDADLAAQFQPQLVSLGVLDGLNSAIGAVLSAAKLEASLRRRVIQQGKLVRELATEEMLLAMPIERLRTVTDERLILSPLLDAGIESVGQVLDSEEEILDIDGLGWERAGRIVGVAHTVRRTVFEEMPVRIDISMRSEATTSLLEMLRDWREGRLPVGSHVTVTQAEQLRSLTDLDPDPDARALIEYNQPIENLLANIDAVKELGEHLRRREILALRDDVWDDFNSRPADYFSMLSELGLLTEDQEAAFGYLPEQIVEAVRAFELDGRFLTASLRGYQSFAARFALVQRKVIVGDEMGLGKTIEALAVLAHRRAHGDQHFLVICPAALVTNWLREVSSKTELRAHRIHGEYKKANARRWLQEGGVAVTTFETLAWLESEWIRPAELSCVVVDEAHYIKNPDAQRSQRSCSWIEDSEYALLLTGTPLENHVGEFCNLVNYLQPDLGASPEVLSPLTFRTKIAPAYLRRNQEDVLTELPELTQVDEWVALEGVDARHYEAAVVDGNFMAMRQAAFRDPQSAKLRRLKEVVEEAEENNRKVLVFSFFRETLAMVADGLSGAIYGPLTGSISPAARQEIIDRFSAAPGGAVLASQISVGGVGLNIQAASVVVICEPQLKPTAEWQAISRAHRMGQLQHVQVHRLLSEEGIDPKLVEILASKAQEFSDYAQMSETAAAAPEAVDATDAELAKQLIAEERQRIHGLQSGHETTDSEMFTDPAA